MQISLLFENVKPDVLKWFGNSKVVDSDGKPLIVYHGTNQKFESFEAGRAGGIYFTPSLKTATHYGQKVIACYLKIKKLADLCRPSKALELAVSTFNKNGGWSSTDNWNDEEFRNKRNDNPDFDPALDLTWEMFDCIENQVRETLINAGYDGVKLEEYNEGVSYVVFNPSQVFIIPKTKLKTSNKKNVKSQDGIVVLSLFDGMSCGMLALQKAGIKVAAYYASEVDKAATKVSKHHFPNIIRIGDVTKIKYLNGILQTEYGDYEIGKVDLLMGGSPCQSLSSLGDGTGLRGKSKLFYHWLRLLRETNPKNFLLENVTSNKKEAQKGINEITALIGVQPMMIDSNLFSAQNRKRLYWTNIKVPPLPTQNNTTIKDILDTEASQDLYLSPKREASILKNKEQYGSSYSRIYQPNELNQKSRTLIRNAEESWRGMYVVRGGRITKLSPEECERLQTVPTGFTNVPGVRPSHRYEMLGNGWTVDVIAHILKGL